MSVMTEIHPELKQLGYEDIIRKNELAIGLFNEICESITLKESFTDEEAIGLGGQLVAYWAEAVLHNEDRITLEYEAGIIDRKVLMENYNLPALHARRLEVEKVLSESCRGDFKSMRTLLLGWCESWVRLEWRPKLNQLAMSFPDYGPPFVLPPPAWMVKENEYEEIT